MLQTFQPDDCCGKHLSKALRGGDLDAAAEWECPRCGCGWKAREVEGLRHWEPVPLICIW